MGVITTNSPIEEMEDFILYHKYVSSDYNYGEAVEQFLIEAEDIVDHLPKDGTVPEDLIEKLIELVGNEYDG